MRLVPSPARTCFCRGGTALFLLTGTCPNWTALPGARRQLGLFGPRPLQAESQCVTGKEIAAKSGREHAVLATCLLQAPPWLRQESVRMRPTRLCDLQGETCSMMRQARGGLLAGLPWDMGDTCGIFATGQIRYPLQIAQAGCPVCTTYGEEEGRPPGTSAR